MVMTVKQVAEKIQVTPRTVYDWIRQGKLQAYRAGRQYRITDEQLEGGGIPDTDTEKGAVRGLLLTLGVISIWLMNIWI